MRQLLWLTQAEFRLPDAKKFDSSVQAQLRGILGVLQTPLDDRFIERVKKRWNVWHSGQRKVGKQPPIKAGCGLLESLDRLENAKKDLQETETKFLEVEGLLKKTSMLEDLSLDLRRQQSEEAEKLQSCQKERERCQGRIAARKVAEGLFAWANKEQQSALEQETQRDEAVKRLGEAEESVQKAKTEAWMLEPPVQTIEDQQKQRKTNLNTLRGQRMELQQSAKYVAEILLALEAAEKLKLAEQDLEAAQTIADRISEIRGYVANNPTPDKAKLDALKKAREEIFRLRAERDAASMTLVALANEGSEPAQLALDGAPLQKLTESQKATPLSIRRKAVLRIPAWGMVEFSRGSTKGDFDQIEVDLAQRE
jgi:cell fate (sporulation/competence/biofilm development) regulator YmcA (YheA/YmcA/DUF963 family)